MAQKTDSALQTQNDTIQTETTANANTAARIGQMYEDIIDSKINNDKIVDEDDMVSNSATLVPSQQSVKAYVDAIGDPVWGAITGTLGDQTDLQTALGLKANLASPALTGTPTAPTAAAATNSTQIATTAFVRESSATAITDAASMDLTSVKHTLATSSATRTFTISYAGDDITLEITLSATASVLTFPATSLCVSDGVASGDNTCSLSGVSGDKYILAIKKIGSAYYVVSKNFGQ